MTELPIACTLTPDEMRERSACIEALFEDALIYQREIDGGLRIRLRDTPDVERQVRDLIAAESRC